MYRRARCIVPLQVRGATLRGVGALEGVGDLQEEMLVGDGADELEANWEVFGCEAAGDGDGGYPGEVCGAIGAE